VEACIGYSLLAAEADFRKKYRSDFETKVLPLMLTLLTADPTLADAALLALTNFCSEDTFRSKMGGGDGKVLTELFACVKQWSDELATTRDVSSTLRAGALHTLLGLVQNLGMEPVAAAYLQRAPSFNAVVKLLDVHTADVYVRAALIIARITSTTAVAELLLRNEVVQKMVGLVASRSVKSLVFGNSLEPL
jgi:hypothetical protein